MVEWDVTVDGFNPTRVRLKLDTKDGDTVTLTVASIPRGFV